MESLTLAQLSVGDAASLDKTITERDIELYAEISGDYNPLHVDAEFAAAGPFGERVAHGPLTMAVAAGVIGTALPGVGTVAVTTRVASLAPARMGDTTTAHVEVGALDIARPGATMDLRGTNQDGQVVAGGEAVVIPPRQPLL